MKNEKFIIKNCSSIPLLNIYDNVFELFNEYYDGAPTERFAMYVADSDIPLDVTIRKNKCSISITIKD